MAGLPRPRGNGFIWDDDDYILHNVTLRSLHGVAARWLNLRALHQYYPMVHSTYWIEYHLWGLNPLGFHLDNVLLHALKPRVLLCAFFAAPGIGAIFQHFWASGGGGGGGAGAGGTFLAASRYCASLPDAAWVAAVVFALHPVCVESVAWATERKNVLMLFFYLLSPLGLSALRAFVYAFPSRRESASPTSSGTASDPRK